MKPSAELKPLFVERMQKLLGKDFDNYLKVLKEEPLRTIRCNTLKISPEKLKKKLEAKGWKIQQPFKEYPEVIIIESQLEPGGMGRAVEHLLGYYYAQEISSMLPVIAINPKQEEKILDLCAAPGSKTTQLAADVKNTGIIIANEISLHRMKILASNLERCGATNVILTKKEGGALCKRFANNNFQFDKILLDAPCSGEGTLRSNPKTALMWNAKTINYISKIQKQLFESAIEILKPEGEMIYSTCTHAPEENEEVVDYILKKYKGILKIEKIKLPIKTREGLTEWEGKKYLKEVKNACRIYPQDNNTEGFFIAKFKKIK